MAQDPFGESIKRPGRSLALKLIERALFIGAAVAAGAAIIGAIEASPKPRTRTVAPARVAAFIDNYTEQLAELSKTTPMVQQLGAKSCRLQVGKGYGSITNTAPNPIYYSRIEASGHTSGYQFVVGKSGKQNSTVDWLDITRINLDGCGEGETADEDIDINGDSKSWDMLVSFTDTKHQNTGVGEFATDPKEESGPPNPNFVNYLTPRAFNAIKKLSYSVLTDAAERRDVPPITSLVDIPSNLGRFQGQGPPSS